MTVHLEKHLRSCTVLITDGQGKAAGSGFFVAEGLVLTAAHVVYQAGEGVRAQWNGVVLNELSQEWLDPPPPKGPGSWPLPDLALLRVHDDAASGHPCVLLGNRLSGSTLLAEGYTRGTSGGYAPDSARLEFETVRSEGIFSVIKCKDSIIDDGLSGGPILDLGSGEVVGVTKGQRTSLLPIGGIAIASSVLSDLYPDLWMANARFHHTDRRWEFARLNSSQVMDLTAATRGFLRMVDQVIAERPAFLPPGAVRADIHQMPSVRALSHGRPAEPAHQDELSSEELGVNDVRFEGVFQWAPLRVRWRSIVLRGMPGLGKSWLLNSHANAVAADSLEKLNDNRVDGTSVSLPVLIDCADLGRMLPTAITRDSVLRALANAIQADAEADWAQIPVDAIIRLAYEDGRLISCLDALDEVSIADRQKIRQALPILTERGNQLLITSRPSRTLHIDTAALGGCFNADVVGFSPGQVFAFARSWFARHPVRSTEFEAELLDRPELRRLAKVPLLAAFLCRLASEGNNVQVLPSTRVEVLQSVMLGALSGRWRDPTLQALDPDSPPDPTLRLRILSDAIGRLSRPWRSRVDRFSRPNLAVALREHPDHARTATEADTRWYVWQTLRPAMSSQPRPLSDPLIWEYMFDGLLAHDLSESSESMIRFTHPVLAEYCMASYLASQTADELRGIVTAHRWFDTPWYEIWPLTAGLMAHPGTLVELLLDTPTDSWYEQTFLASRCVAVAGARMSTELKTRVLSAVISATQSWRSFDRERALLHLGELVHARLDEAVKASRRLLNSEEIESSTLLRVAGLLAEIGDPAGLKIARKCVSDRGVPTVYRAWNARAIVLANDPEGLVALQSAIRNARTVSELRILVNAIPVESQVGSNLAAQILRDHEVHTRIRATVGAALIRTGDAHRIRLAKELAATPLTVWHLRAALISELLAVGEDDVLQLGLELFDDPNLSADQRVTLVESLVRRGETAVLPRAVQMLSRRDISWEERRQLARSVVELGPAGIEELLTQVRSPLDIDLKMRHIIALVEAGECLDLAAELVADPGAPAWIRTRVATSLLERGYLSIPHTVVAELATDFEPEHDFQGELIIAMAGRDIPGAGAAAVSLLGRERASKANYAGSKKFIGGLATAGPEGYASLDRIARDNELAEEDRALAIDAMADTNPGEAAQLALSLAEQFTKFANSRLTLLLADKGVVEVADQLSTQLRDEPAAYRALFQLLSSPRASQELVEALLPAAHAATIAEAPEPPAPLTLDSHFLEEAGITWSSEAEKEAITDWVADRIREKVSTKVFSFLTTSQLDEYEQLESAEQHVEFLATRSGGYPELVRSQAAVVQQEIRDNPSIVPPFNVVQTMQPMRRLSYIAAAIEEWVILTQSSGPQSSAQFLAANESVIVTPEGHALLRIACQMTAAWNPYEGHQFLVEVALRNGLQASRKLMEDSDKLHDLLREYLNEGNGMQLLYAALAGLVLEPGSEVVAFYGALGAALLENMELSVALMALSGRSASEDQRKDGLATLQENAERFQWNEECVRVLRGALRNELGDIE